MGSNLLLVPAELEHAEALGAQMRQEDLQEVLALGYIDGLSALKASLATSSQAFAATVDDEVVALFGVGPSESDKDARDARCAWALTGRCIAEHRFHFLRASTYALSLLSGEVLWNWVDARHAKALRWLKWLGFSIGDSRPYERAGGRVFHPVALRRHAWAR